MFYWSCLDQLLPFEQFFLIVRKPKPQRFWKPTPVNLRRESKLRKSPSIYPHTPVTVQLLGSRWISLSCVGSLHFSLGCFSVLLLHLFITSALSVVVMYLTDEKQLRDDRVSFGLWFQRNTVLIWGRRDDSQEKHGDEQKVVWLHLQSHTRNKEREVRKYFPMVYFHNVLKQHRLGTKC